MRGVQASDAGTATGAASPGGRVGTLEDGAGAAASGAAVEVEGLERRYGDRPALRGVTLHLPAGGSMAVLGPNGAGKTTLLRVLAGLLRPHAGTVRVAGATLPTESWKVRGRVGYLGHEPLLYRELTARENLRFHADLHGVGHERVEELLARLGIGRRADEPVRNLSRGMVQRAAAARAVLHDPPLLLLDEPRASLDPAAAALVEPLVGREAGRTRVLVTHDVEGGLAECNLALGLRAGRQLLAGNAGEVEPDRVRDLYR
jgi:heme exporter protein A